MFLCCLSFLPHSRTGPQVVAVPFTDSSASYQHWGSTSYPAVLASWRALQFKLIPVPGSRLLNRRCGKKPLETNQHLKNCTSRFSQHVLWLVHDCIKILHTSALSLLKCVVCEGIVLKWVELIGVLWFSSVAIILC